MQRILPWIVIVPEFQRVAVFRLGRIVGYRGPGVVWRTPFIEQFQLVDSRIVTVDVQPQECITRDNVPITLNAVVYYRVEHPDKAIVAVADYHTATVQIAQSALRSVVGQRTLDQVLGEIRDTAELLERVVDEATDEWGVKVTRVEIKDIRVPDEMKRAMAIEAEAERERRAMLVRATGEREAAQQLLEAARLLDGSPSAYRLRYLQTLLQVSEEGNTIVFADPQFAATAVTAAAHHQAREAARPAPEPPSRE